MNISFGYAKPIDGGFRVISLHGENYATAELPKRTRDTNLPVLVVPENVDRIIRIRELAEQRLDIIRSRIDDTLSEFITQCQDTNSKANRDTSNVSLAEDNLVNLYVSAGLGQVLTDTVGPWLENSNQTSSIFADQMDKWCLKAAQDAGFQVKPRKNRDSLITLLNFLVSGMQATIPDCGDKNCEIHGIRVNPETATYKNTEERKRPNVPEGVVVGENGAG